jgi:hypothetical protein
MEALYRLSWLSDTSGMVPVNWRAMKTEELGSVYESLLELQPQLVDVGKTLVFASETAEQRGNQRKTTGSYYTPDSLVQALLDTALDPVLDHTEAEAADPAKALLKLSVIDPACGSGHFLLAAASRIATRLARIRAEGTPSLADFRHALRDVARCCLYGVDHNPMAVELTKVALWIETVDPGLPLGFLDANIRCGDSLLGVFDLNTLAHGIPDAALKPLAGDEKETARHFEKRNKAEREGQGALDFAKGGGRMPAASPMGAEAWALRAMPEDSPDEIAAKRKRFEVARTDSHRWNLRIAADLYTAAFLAPKTGGVPANHNTVTIPTTAHVWDALAGRTVYGLLVGRAQELAAAARAFHWPLEFPHILANGSESDAGKGFDVVLGNPPWEVMQLSEEEYFAQRLPEIAELAGAARKQAIADLETENPAIFASYLADKRRSAAANNFCRCCGRFDLAARGKINTYALFAELFASLTSKRGRAGVIVPTGIATDATTAPFFAALVSGHRLHRLIDFENREGLFPAVDSRMKFCLLTIGREAKQADLAIFLTDTRQLAEPERHFSLSAEDIARINPNTKTAPIFRTRSDAELGRAIHVRIPIFVNDMVQTEGNLWGVTIATRIWNMAEDAEWFRTASQLAAAQFEQAGNEWVAKHGLRSNQRKPDIAGWKEEHVERYVPLYEAKMINQFDHRWATYDDSESRDSTGVEKADSYFEPRPRYWVPFAEVETRLELTGWKRGWLMG